MKTKNIIACLVLLITAQAVNAQSNAEALIRLLVDQVKNHKNVEMTFNYQISTDGKNFAESNASDGADNTPLKLLTSLDESYAASLSGIDAQGVATVELANPKGQYKRVTLKINTKKTELKSADIYLEDGSKVAINVEEMKYDQPLDSNFFTFDAKKHPKVDMIDMR